MIDLILAQLREQGVEVPKGARDEVVNWAHTTYGGERVYIPKLPKMQSAARIARAAREGARTNAEIVVATGLSLRHVKAIRRR